MFYDSVSYFINPRSLLPPPIIFENYSTTLMYAARYGHVELVDLLLDMDHEEEVISMVTKLLHTYV